MSAVDAMESSEVVSELAQQLQELGLPAAFGTSKARKFHLTDSVHLNTSIVVITCIMQGDAYEDMAEEGLAAEGDITGAEQQRFHRVELVSQADTDVSANLLVQGSCSQWQQAFDETYGCFYYYRESTQVTPVGMVLS